VELFERIRRDRRLEQLSIREFVTVIDGWLIADKEAPRKQRHTARRVWQRLVAAYDARLAEVPVSRYVARLGSNSAWNNVRCRSRRRIWPARRRRPIEDWRLRRRPGRYGPPASSRPTSPDRY
jgi:hypothetical protein